MRYLDIGHTRRSLAIVVALIAAVTLAACGSSSSSSGGGTTKPNSAIRIGMVGFAGVGPYNTGAKAEAKKLGIQLNIQDLTTVDAAGEQAALDALVALHPDAVIVTVQDATALQARLHQIARQGIKVITYDSNAVNPKAIPVQTYASSDYYAMGQQAGQSLADLVGRKGAVLLLTASPGNLGLVDNINGVLSTLKKYPAITPLAVQYNDGDASKAAAITSATLAAHPDLAGVYAGSTYNGSQGVTATLAQRQLTGKVKVVALDAGPDGVTEVRNGRIQALSSSQLLAIGHVAVSSAVEAVKGKKLPPLELLPGCILTSRNIDAAASKKCIY